MVRIGTERLRLRTPGERDLPGWLAYRNDPDDLAAQRLRAETEEKARDFLREQAALPDDATGWRMLAVEERGGPERGPVCGIIGEVGVFRSADRAWEGNIGWWLHRGARGRGYATEAARGLVGWCFGALELRRITAGCLADNAASLRVMARLGMRVEARTIESREVDGAWFDEVGCGLLRREWEERGRVAP